MLIMPLPGKHAASELEREEDTCSVQSRTRSEVRLLQKACVREQVRRQITAGGAGGYCHTLFTTVVGLVLMLHGDGAREWGQEP